MLITNLASNVDTAKAAFSCSISCAEKYIEGQLQIMQPFISNDKVVT